MSSHTTVVTGSNGSITTGVVTDSYYVVMDPLLRSNSLTVLTGSTEPIST